MNEDSNSYRSRFPSLAHLFGAYFYQCAYEYDGGAEGIVAQYAYQEGLACTKQAVKELYELIALDLPVQELERVVTDCLHSGYFGYDEDNPTQAAYDWLRKIRDTLAESAATMAEAASAKERREP